jgi:alpha-tubulin suppressor-like RCC1 family protein
MVPEVTVLFSQELRQMPKRRKMLADLAPVYQVACGVTHTMAIVKLDEETGEGDVYAWGCGGSGRTGFCRPLISGTYLADSDEEEEGGGMEEGSRLVEWTATDARDTFAATRVYDCYTAWESRRLTQKMMEEAGEDSGDDEDEDEEVIDDDDVMKR